MHVFTSSNKYDRTFSGSNPAQREQLTNFIIQNLELCSHHYPDFKNQLLTYTSEINFQQMFTWSIHDMNPPQKHET